jgi:hypothetical protein
MSKRITMSGEDGSVTLEFALVATIFMMLMMAIFEIAIMLFAQNSVQMAAGELVAVSRKVADPEVAIAAWRETGSSGLMTDAVVPSFTCYAGVEELLASSETSDCANARVIQWETAIDWSAMTPFMTAVIPANFVLRGMGVSYR